MSTKKYTDAAKAIHAKVEKSQGYRTNFVRFNLDEDDKAAIKALEWDLNEYDSAVSGFTEQGYSFSYKFYQEDGTWGCFLNPKGEEHVNSGWTLAGRGSTPSKALRQLVYLHFIRFGDGWPKDTPFKREPIDD